MKARSKVPWILAPLAVALSGCWSGRIVINPAGSEPSWAAQASGAYGGGQGQDHFQGVGRFTAEAKPKILTQGADDMAQAAISRVMDNYLDILTVDMNVPPSIPALPPAVPVSTGAMTSIVSTAPVSISSATSATVPMSSSSIAGIALSSAPVSISSAAPEASPDFTELVPPLSDDAVVALRHAAKEVLEDKSKISERWVSHNSALSLCALDFREFKTSLAASPGLAPGTTGYLSLNADAAFARLLSRQKAPANPPSQ